MSKQISQNHLTLSQYESKTSRLFLLSLPSEESLLTASTGCLFLGRSISERNLWESLLENDLIIILSLDSGRINTLAFYVHWKGIKSAEASPFAVEKPYITFVELVGSGENSTVKFGGYDSSKFWPLCPRPIFQELWESCTPVENGKYRIANKQWTCPIKNEYEIVVASSYSDYKFVSDVSIYHPFGPRKAFLTLIAKLHGQRQGAVLVELSSDMSASHQAAWRIFRNDFVWIKKQAVCIVRIYTHPKAINKWRLHRSLLDGVSSVAPSLVAKPLSLIEGVSYDYHPVAIPSGFQVEIPHRIEGSFYYWRPVNLPPRLHKDQPTSKERVKIKHSVQKLLRVRRNVRYWLAPGAEDDITFAVEKNAWAVRRNATNTGRWRALSQEHIVFLVSKDDRIRAYGVVAGTAIRDVPGLKEFPLWIDFDAPMISGLEIDLAGFTNPRWYEELDRGGLIPLPGEIGSHIKRLADTQKMEGKMWVEPNPFLLHRTEFEVIHNQVFVVQSWLLKDTVFPIIKEILSEAGYTVKYSADRDGQVIFDDIWLMLNESEVVIVDFTNRRPNVYLEYGMALVLGKPIVAITQDEKDIPSDTPQLKRIVYQDKLGDSSLSRLPGAIQDTLIDIQRILEKRLVK